MFEEHGLGYYGAEAAATCKTGGGREEGGSLRRTRRGVYPSAVFRGTCLWRIHMLSDSTCERCPSEASGTCGAPPAGSEAIRSANRAAFTSSNSDWVHGQCSLSMSAGYSGEHESLENQAATGV